MCSRTSNVAHLSACGHAQAGKVRRYIKPFVASEPCLLPRHTTSDVLESVMFTITKTKSWVLCSVASRLQRFLQERSPLCGGVS